MLCGRGHLPPDDAAAPILLQKTAITLSLLLLVIEKAKDLDRGSFVGMHAGDYVMLTELEQQSGCVKKEGDV